MHYYINVVFERTNDLKTIGGIDLNFTNSEVMSVKYDQNIPMVSFALVSGNLEEWRELKRFNFGNGVFNAVAIQSMDMLPTESFQLCTAGFLISGISKFPLEFWEATQPMQHDIRSAEVSGKLHPSITKKAAELPAVIVSGANVSSDKQKVIVSTMWRMPPHEKFDEDLLNRLDEVVGNSVNRMNGGQENLLSERIVSSTIINPKKNNLNSAVFGKVILPDRIV
jgi:hypothetical protein